MSNIINDSDITHYSSQFENKDFYITENDIADLDLFFMVKTNGTLKTNKSSDVRIVREPIFYFSCSSHTAINPIFGVGHDGVVGYSKGSTVYAGKIITNAFHNIPLINLLIEAGITSGDPADLPPIDFYIVNKKRKESSTKKASLFQDCIIENLKILNWNFEQGVDTPGRFFVFEFIATSFKGIHLKKYLENQLYYNSDDVSLTPNLAFDSSYDVNSAKSKALENAADTIGNYSTDLNKIINNIKNSGIITTATSENELKNIESKINAFQSSFSSENSGEEQIETENTIKESLVSLQTDLLKAYELLNLRKANDNILSGLSLVHDEINGDKLLKIIKSKPNLLATLSDSDIFKKIKITFNSSKNPLTFFESWSAAKKLTTAEFSIFQKEKAIEIIFLRPDLVNTETNVYNFTFNDVSEYVPNDIDFTLTFSYEQTKNGIKETFSSFSDPVTFKSTETKETVAVNDKDLSADVNDIIAKYASIGFTNYLNPILATTFENNTPNYKHGHVNDDLIVDLKELASKLNEYVYLNLEYRYAPGESTHLFSERANSFTNAISDSRIKVVNKTAAQVSAGSASSIYITRTKNTTTNNTVSSSDEAVKFPIVLNTEYDIFLGYSNDSSTYNRNLRTDEIIKITSLAQFVKNLKGTYQINFVFYTDTYATSAQNKNILSGLKNYATKIIDKLKTNVVPGSASFSYKTANVLIDSSKYKKGDKPPLYSEVDSSHSEEFGTRLNRRFSIKIVKVV